MLNLGRLPRRSPSLHTEPDGSAVPDAFGPFRVLHQIGAGTLGPVFRAYDAEGERLVAVKLFRLDLPPERVHQLVDAFERLIGADLGHPSLAMPIATGIVGARPYLAVDYVSAESLDLALREYGPAPAHDAIRVITQLAAALDFAAAVKVVHGAMHPRDVLLSADETRITGIGIARALERVGVPAPMRRPYTAPERVAGGAWDRRADVFTLAALSHELLWGRRIAGTGQHVAAALAALPGARLDGLQDAFARALAEEAADRFDTALAFAEALNGCFDFEAAAAAAAEAPAVSATGASVAPAEPSSRAAEISTPGPVPVSASKPAADAEPRLPLEPAAVERVPAPPPPVPVAAAPIAEPRETPIAAPASKAAELELRAAETTRFRDVEAAPRPARPPAPKPPAPRKRSALWPVAAALVIGVALGSAVAWQLASRPQPSSPIADDTIESPSPVPTDRADTAAAPPSTPAPRESTEVAVEPPKAVASQGEQTPAADAPRAAPPAASTRPQRRTPSPRPPAPSPARAPERSADPASGTVGRFVGGLSVDSRPTGARVFLDGRLIGTTPMTMANVPAGEHAIRLERDGYRRWSSSIRVVAAEQNRVTASLER
jgi:eukaryotic-like serine/threonine-protein kinase